MAEKGGRRTVLTPTPFAIQISEYLWHLVDESRGDRSGRWLASKTDRSNAYWQKILNDKQAMTTNDIAIVAALFEMSPYDFVRNARAHSSNVVQFPNTSNVSGEEETDLSKIELDEMKYPASEMEDSGEMD